MKKIVVTSLMIEVFGPPEASVKRIKFVEYILREAIKDLNKQFRNSRFPQAKGFSFRPEPKRRRR